MPPSCRSSTIGSTLCCFSRGTSAFDRVGLVEELEPGDAGRRDDQRRALEGLADERDLRAAEPLTDLDTRQQRVVRVRVDHVRREVLEDRAVERRRVAAVDRVAASAWAARGSGRAVRRPYCIRSSSLLPSSNSWLPTPIVSSPSDGSWPRSSARRGTAPGRKRARADQVAGADDERVRRSSEPSAFRCVARYSAPPAGRLVDDRARGRPTRLDGRSNRPGVDGLEVAVEVVERQDLDVGDLSFFGGGAPSADRHDERGRDGERRDPDPLPHPALPCRRGRSRHDNSGSASRAIAPAAVRECTFAGLVPRLSRERSRSCPRPSCSIRSRRSRRIRAVLFPVTRRAMYNSSERPQLHERRRARDCEAIGSWSEGRARRLRRNRPASRRSRGRPVVQVLLEQGVGDESGRGSAPCPWKM